MNAKELIKRMENLAKKENTPVRWRVTQFCGDPYCSRFHPERGLEITPSGKWFYLPSPYGHGSLIQPLPEREPVSDDPVRLAKEILKWARESDPFLPYLSYPQHIDVDPDGALVLM